MAHDDEVAELQRRAGEMETDRRLRNVGVVTEGLAKKGGINDANPYTPRPPPPGASNPGNGGLTETVRRAGRSTWRDIQPLAPVPSHVEPIDVAGFKALVDDPAVANAEKLIDCQRKELARAEAEIRRLQARERRRGAVVAEGIAEVEKGRDCSIVRLAAILCALAAMEAKP